VLRRPREEATVTQSAFYLITGSSGCGKTTLLRRVVAAVYPHLSVPSIEEMVARHGC
jgi:ABC-type lipoprotein export system ATPase subunit